MPKTTRTAAQRTDVLLHEYEIRSLAAPTQEDRRKLAAMTPDQRRALWDEGIMQAMDQPATKVTKEEIRNRVLSRSGRGG